MELLGSYCGGWVRWRRYYGFAMPFPIKTCALCGEEFELKPNKPGFANRCPECSEAEAVADPGTSPLGLGAMKADAGLNAERRRVMRDLLYRKES